ncbi:hypothetical protein A3Q56_05639 [Intoshia linei]|uniref:DUF4795 domain-containing protein n=1 Tax=Intoshia linei TaxID=1819745 RepID=A0A177AXP6_9BILA|nr:hypothetical protein A3Q56_05639 [Intoshia linei]
MIMTQVLENCFPSKKFNTVNFEYLYVVLKEITNRLEIKNLDIPNNFDRKDVDVSDNSTETDKDHELSNQDYEKEPPSYYDRFQSMENFIVSLKTGWLNKDQVIDQKKIQDDLSVSDLWQKVQIQSKVDMNTEAINKLVGYFDNISKENQNRKNESLKIESLLEALSTKVDGMSNKISNLVEQTSILDKLKNMIEANQEYMVCLKLCFFLIITIFPSTLEYKKTYYNREKTVAKTIPVFDESTLDKYLQSKDLEEINTSLQNLQVTIDANTDKIDDALKNDKSKVFDALKQELEDVKLVSERLNRKLMELAENIYERLNEKSEKQVQQVVKFEKQGATLNPDSINNLTNELGKIENLKNNIDGKFTDFEELIFELSDKIDNIKNAFLNVQNKHIGIYNLIEDIKVLCRSMEENKVDKDYVATAVDPKADKHMLSSKVEQDLFVKEFELMNENINNILTKFKDESKKTELEMDKLGDEVNYKVNKSQFLPLKLEIEKKLKSILRKLRLLEMKEHDENHEAAAFRSKTPYNCISCDKVVEISIGNAAPSIPVLSSFPTNTSTKMYTSFEIDQIRQYAKFGQDAFPEMTTLRNCGGIHTLTFPTKRITKLINSKIHNYINKYSDLANKNTQNIRGINGNIYRAGIYDYLPDIDKHQNSPKLQKPQTANSKKDVTMESPRCKTPYGNNCQY